MNSIQWSEFVTPWALDNVDKTFNWYVLIIDHIPSDVEMSLNYIVIEAIDTSFSNNEWRFRQFTMFYQQYLDLVTWHMEIVHNCTYEQLQSIERTGLHRSMNGNKFIIREEIPFINFVLYTNDELLERLHEACQDFDIFDEEIIPYMISGKIFFIEMKKYFNDIPELRYIRHLIFRICTFYLFIYLCITNSDYNSEWTEQMSQSFKERIEKFAKFDIPLESLDYCDIYNEYYVFYTFLIRACNYNGRLIDDYVEGVVDNK